MIAALAIELGFEGAEELARHGTNMHTAWALIACGFAVGAVAYYVASLFHAMIPEALHKGGSTVILPAVAGFLFALYLALMETAVS